jgi:hypothetical protein
MNDIINRNNCRIIKIFEQSDSKTVTSDTGSRIQGRAGRPNLLRVYLERFQNSRTPERPEGDPSIAAEVLERMSDSSYLTFCRRAGIGTGRRRGRRSKIERYLADHERSPIESTIPSSYADLSPSSLRKIRIALGLQRTHPNPGRPERIAIFREACVRNIREGRPEYIGSVLDYARTKLSRSSYFKLKRELSDMDIRPD